jgi:hypothetical protein
MKALGRTVVGILAGFLTLEGGLRLFATTDPVPPARISTDSLGGPSVVRRQLQEGVATYGFSTGGARLTGHEPAGSGNVAVILGDSYVAAVQVGDRETMGAQLEDLARADGLPLDVRQYGWPNAAPGQYILSADAVERRWKPSRVFVVVSDNDMDFRSQVASSARLRVDRNDSVRIVGALMDTMPIQPRRGSVVHDLVRYRLSVIGLRLKRQATGKRQEIVPEVGAPVESPADSAELAALPRAVARGLSRAYGPDLSVIFLATVGIATDSTPTRIERAFIEACSAEGVDCISTREAMIARRAQGQLSFGTGTTAPGHGHLSPAGHRVVAELMWKQLQAWP